jgi:hypothetical protein
MSCPIIPDGWTKSCGRFPSVGRYRVTAVTQRCGVLSADFPDAVGGRVTRSVFCNSRSSKASASDPAAARPEMGEGGLR